MGYEINMAPPRSWYCGDITYSKAKAPIQLDDRIHDFSKFYRFAINHD